jgi:hypothetical protein
LRLLAALAFVLGAYAILTTVARGGIIALLAASLVLAMGMLRMGAKQAGSGRRGLLATGLLVIALAVVGAGVFVGGFLQQRIATTWDDAGIRMDHWQSTLGLMGDDLPSWAVGMGLGSFPERYLISRLDAKPGTYSYQEEGGNRFLRFSSGGDLYMAQAVDVRTATPYTLSFDTRNVGGSQRLEYSLCEKKLFNSRNCVWGGVSLVSDVAQWQRHKVSLASGEVGAGNWLTRRSVQLSLYNPQAGALVDVDNLQLLDAAGANLLANGDFAAGGDHWFFKSGDHLAWHAKNLWVHTLFEQGVLGVIALGVLVLAATSRLSRAAWRGDPYAATLLAAVAAMGVMSIVDSLVDAPRLTAMLMFLLLLGAGYAGRLGSAR